jgi:hypothetical protein
VQESGARELPVAPRWFEVTEIADGVFRITEPYVHAYVRSNAWLIRGSESHLLVDSGLGVGRLPDELAGQLDRPVIAVATHAISTTSAGWPNSRIVRPTVTTAR